MIPSPNRLPDGELLARLHELVRRGNGIEAELLAHLGEVDARRLYLEQGCPSMFAYCQRVLHFAEGVTYKRIQAARLARRHPVILEALRRGELHLTAVSLLAPRLTTENEAELIGAARHRSADEIRRLLADREPRPDVRSRMRRLPTVAQTGVPEVARPQAPTRCEVREPGAGEDGLATEQQPAAVAPPPPPPRARTQPLGGERYGVQFTADPALYAQLQELRALLRHEIPDGDLGRILARAVALLLEHVKRRKLGQTAAPRPEQPPSERPSRHVPAAVRRAVWARDGGRCSYVSPGGRRCDARDWLEFDHVEGWARTRSHPVEGITLRCRGHNQLRAERDFGTAHMARYRKDEGPLDPPVPRA